jgi:IclR family acetate operon transcriptional repressor
VTATTSTSSRTALQKVVAVTEALANESRLTDIARVTELPVSTTHRILQELVAAGWAREGSGRTYSLGARLLSLPARSSGHEELARVARPILRELSVRTGRTVHLALLEGDEAVYVDKIEGRQAYAMKSRVGASIPLHCTAIGKALLAAMTDDEVRAFAARTGLPRQTERTITRPGDLLKHLATVRSRGYSVDDEENETHTRCIGAVIVNHRGDPIGGVSVSSLVFDLTGAQVRSLAPQVVEAARHVSDGLTHLAWG